MKEKIKHAHFKDYQALCEILLMDNKNMGLLMWRADQKAEEVTLLSLISSSVVVLVELAATASLKLYKKGFTFS